MVTKKKTKSKKQEKKFNLFLLVVPIVLGLFVVASYGVLFFNNSITGAVSGTNSGDPEIYVGEIEAGLADAEEVDSSSSSSQSDVETDVDVETIIEDANRAIADAAFEADADGGADEAFDSGHHVRKDSEILDYGTRDASSMFSNPTEDISGILNLLNRIPGVNMKENADWFMADWFDSFKNSGWYRSFFGSASDKANAWCYSWLQRDEQLGNYAGYGNGGAYFNLQAEYVDIGNPLDDNDINRIYKIPWVVALPNGNSGEKWNWEIYVSESNSDSGTSLYSFEDGSTHFIAKFGNGTVDYRGAKMFISTSSNVYDYACIRFFTDDGAKLPFDYIPAMPKSGYWCTRIVESINYDYDEYCKKQNLFDSSYFFWNYDLCDSDGDDDDDDGSDTQTSGEQNSI